MLIANGPHSVPGQMFINMMQTRECIVNRTIMQGPLSPVSTVSLTFLQRYKISLKGT